MHRLWWVAVCGLLAAGCGKPSGDAAVGPGRPGAEFFPPAAPPPPIPVVSPAEVAVNYERQLAGADAGGRQRAAQALRQLGDDGYAVLVRTVRKGTPESRQDALRALDTNMIRTHSAELLPLFGDLLRDSSPIVRAMAASRLGVMGKAAAGAKDELSRIAKNDTDRQVRGAAEQAVTAIHFAVTGSMPEGMVPRKNP